MNERPYLGLQKRREFLRVQGAGTRFRRRHLVLLALPNDVEGEATCHYLQEEVVGDRQIKISRIGFGIPSGTGVTYADEVTLRSALDARRDFS